MRRGIMKLNREQVIQALEFCGICECNNEKTNTECALINMPFCKNYLRKQSLALIKELTEENEKFRHNHENLIEECDTFREYAYNMQKYVEYIKHKEEEGYEPSAARYAAEMEMWHVVALEKKKLADENERLKNISVGYRIERNTWKDLCDTIETDTVRKMQARLKKELDEHYSLYFQVLGGELIDRIAKEILEENNG
jgi:hypothetical protein